MCHGLKICIICERIHNPKGRKKDAKSESGFSLRKEIIIKNYNRLLTLVSVTALTSTLSSQIACANMLYIKRKVFTR